MGARLLRRERHSAARGAEPLLDLPDDVRALAQRLELLGGHHHGSRLAALGDDERSVLCAHAPQQRRGVGLELADWDDVFGEIDGAHGGSSVVRI